MKLLSCEFQPPNTFLQNCSDGEENCNFSFVRFRNPEKQSAKGKGGSFLNSLTHCTWQDKDKSKKGCFMFKEAEVPWTVLDHKQAEICVVNF